MKITIIAAMAENRVIGKNNDLIWHMPDDLQHFKKLTAGHHVIMGRKTYQSMGKPLPKRVNIVVTTQANFQAPGCIVVHNLESALEKASIDEQPFIIGGAEIYRQALPLAHKMELTKIHHKFEGDTFFPKFDPKVWKLMRGEKKEADEKNPYPYEYLTYLKINPDSYN